MVIDASFLEGVEEVESPNSCTFIELGLDEMSLISRMDSPLPRLPLEVSQSHFLFE
jgi:hypothetical protein